MKKNMQWHFYWVLSLLIFFQWPALFAFTAKFDEALSKVSSTLHTLENKPSKKATFEIYSGLIESIYNNHTFGKKERTILYDQVGLHAKEHHPALYRSVRTLLEQALLEKNKLALTISEKIKKFLSSTQGKVLSLTSMVGLLAIINALLGPSPQGDQQPPDRDKIEREKKERERLQQEQEEIARREKLKLERLRQEKLRKEQEEKERLEKEKKEKLQKEQEENAGREKLRQESLRQEQLRKQQEELKKEQEEERIRKEQSDLKNFSLNDLVSQKQGDPETLAAPFYKGTEADGEIVVQVGAGEVRKQKVPLSVSGIARFKTLKTEKEVAGPCVFIQIPVLFQGKSDQDHTNYCGYCALYNASVLSSLPPLTTIIKNKESALKDGSLGTVVTKQLEELNSMNRKRYGDFFKKALALVRDYRLGLLKPGQSKNSFPAIKDPHINIPLIAELSEAEIKYLAEKAQGVGIETTGICLDGEIDMNQDIFPNIHSPGNRHGPANMHSTLYIDLIKKYMWDTQDKQDEPRKIYVAQTASSGSHWMTIRVEKVAGVVYVLILDSLGNDRTDMLQQEFSVRLLK